MRTALIILCCSLLSLTGCALKVVPEQVNFGTVDTKNNSLSVTKDGISITTKVSDTEIEAYNLENTVAAFSVTIKNQSGKEFPIDGDSFLLVDDSGRQYFPLTPARVKEIIAKDSYYLIPYPYVGFYYLEDYERSSFYNTFNSQLPYYYEVYPQDIYTKALTDGVVIPHAALSGLVYFRIDLATVKGVKLLFYRKGTSKSAQPDFSFPFRIEK